MKKNIIYITAVLGLGLLTTTSCSDFLDKEPDERVELKNEDQVTKFLTSGYTSGNYGWMCELSSDNLTDNNSRHASVDDKVTREIYYKLPSYNRMDDELFRFEQVKSYSQQDSPTFIWETAYNAIATANHALEAINKIKAENGGTMTPKLAAAYGEAKLIRAYHHFILVNIFSQAYKDPEASKADLGIPYSTTPETTVKPHYKRPSVAENYDSIQADLEEGLKYVSDAYYEKPKWHFNVNAAHAFAARFYLYKRDYAKVIEHANAVLGTDETVTKTLLTDYTGFSRCVNSSDYANVWQSPDSKSNIMLFVTSSLYTRHALTGNRYTLSGTGLTNTLLRYGPTWSVKPLPVSFVAGLAFSTTSNQDYGFIQTKTYEKFQYTDKVSGIGYPQTIRREFTTDELLLERAEAKLLGLHDVDGAYNDIAMYLNNIQTFDEATQKSMNRYIKTPTKELLLNYYSTEGNPNCFTNWDFTQNMSSSFVIPKDVTPWMNCINDMRRIETLNDGLRFFDLKRWGIEYSHIYGGTTGGEKIEYKLTWNDPRRAIEIPQEVQAAGLETSRPLATSKLTKSTSMTVREDK